MEVYQRLYRWFGPQGWWPGDGPFEVIIGAILTQSASWKNVEKALARLKEAGALVPSALRALPQGELARLIYSAGYHNVKARKIKAFAQQLGNLYGDDLGVMLSKEARGLREELLTLYGIGEETADAILLYAADRPTFVIDAYTRRIVDRIGLRPKKTSYRAYQGLFMRQLPRNPALFNEFHALLVALGKCVCRKEPLCHQCHLVNICAYGLARAGDETPSISQ